MALGETMIEILCSDAHTSVSLERPSDGPARVLVGINHGVDAIMAAVGNELSEAEARACHQLWADDHAPRTFRQTHAGTLFSFPEA